MARDIFQPGNPADLVPDYKLPASQPRPARDVGLTKVGERRARQDTLDWLDQFPVVQDTPAAEVPKERTWGEAFSDAGLALAQGATQAVGAITRGAGDLPGRDWIRDAGAGSPLFRIAQHFGLLPKNPGLASNPLEKPAAAIERKADEIGQSLTPMGQQMREQSRPKGDLTDPTTWSMGDDPTLAGYGIQAANTFGQFLPQLVTRWLPATGVGMSAAQSQGAASKEARDLLERMPVEQLREGSPRFRELEQEMGDPEAAKARLVREGELLAGELTAPVGALGGLATSKLLGKGGGGAAERAVAGIGGVGGRVARAGVVGGLSGGEEAVQEVGEGVAMRTGVNQATGLGLSVTEDSFGNAVQGFMGGAPGGAARGAMTPATVPPPPPEPAVTPEPPPPGPPLLGGPPPRPALPGKDLAQPTEWELIDPNFTLPLEPNRQLPWTRPGLPYEAPGRIGMDAGPPALERPESVGPAFTVDAEGNVVPTTPESRMADQSRAGDMTRQEGWLGGAVDRMAAEDAAERERMGLTPDVQRAQSVRAEGPDVAGPQDIQFTGADGKQRPWMFRSGAEAVAKRLGGEVVGVPGGFVVRPQPPAATQTGQPATKLAKEPKPPKGAKVPRRVQWARENPFLNWLGRHGVKLELLPDITGERYGKGSKGRSNPTIPYYGKVFRRTGMNIDLLAEQARQDGWLPEQEANDPTDNGGTNRLMGMIAQQMRGEQVLTPDARIAEMEAQLAEQEGELPGEMDAWDENGEYAGSGDADLDAEALAEREAIQAEADMLAETATDDELDALIEAALYGRKGITDAELDQALGTDAEPDADAAVGAEPQERDPGGAGEAVADGAGSRSDAGGQEAGDAGFQLTGQTPEQVRQQQAAQERQQAEKARQDAAPPPEDFRLTGSDRQADVAAAAGQMELGEAPAAETPKERLKRSQKIVESYRDKSDLSPKAEAPKQPSVTGKPLYAARKVAPESAARIIEWAHRQGFKSTLKPEDLHVTVAYSRDPVDPALVGADASGEQLRVEGGQRTVEPLGDKGAVVLKLTSPALQARWQQYRDAGASWDWSEYQPHITITYDGSGVDLSKVKRFVGPIVLGPEYTEDLDVDAADKVEEAPAPSVTQRAEKAVAEPDKAAEQRAAEAKQRAREWEQRVVKKLAEEDAAKAPAKPKKPRTPKRSQPSAGDTFVEQVTAEQPSALRRNIVGNLFGSRRVARPDRTQDDALYDLRSILERDAAARGLPRAAAQGVEIHSVPYAARPIAAALQRLFGVNVVFVGGPATTHAELGFDGLYADDGKTIFVAAGSTKPFHQVIGHEFLHWLSDTNPDVFDAFVSKAAPLLKDRKAAAEYGRSRGRSYETMGLPADRVRAMQWEELYADAFGDAWADPQFWRDLAATMPRTMLQKLADKLRLFFLRVRLAVGLENANPLAADLFRDFGAVKAAVAEAMGQARPAQAQGRGMPMFSRPASKDIEANIKRGQEAMNEVIMTGADRKRAMFRNGLGWVDFVWGDGKKGIRHILDGRMDKDGMIPGEVMQFVTGRLIETVARGTEVRRKVVNASTNVWVEHDGVRAVLVKNPGSNAWMLTGFELKPDERGGGFDPVAPTQTTPTVTRRGLGAGEDSVAPNEPVAKRNQRGGATRKATTAPAQADMRARAKEWFTRYTEVLGSLPDREFYLTERYLAQGRIGKFEKIGESIREAFAKATAKDKGQLYTYFTTASAKPDTIDDAAMRKMAVETKRMIGVVGDRLVEVGLLKPESREAFRDQYLPRLYLAHLLNEGDWRAIGAGKKPSDMGYLKGRKDIPEEIRRVILGEIKDPAFLSAMAIIRPMRDVTLLAFLEKISTSESLVLQKSLVEFDGKKVTPLWLKAEADRLRTQARYMEDRGDAAKAVKLAERMDAAADPVMEALKAGDHTDWKKLPDTHRYGRLRGLHVRKEVYDDIVGVYELTPEDLRWYDPRSVFGYGGVGTKATQWWKVGKVTLNPGSQVRNMVSNMVMLQLSGVSLHMIVPRVVQALKQIRDQKGEGYEIAMRFGVSEATFASQELAEITRDAIRVQLDTMNAHPLRRIMLVAAALVEKAGDFHQLMEVVGKTAKIIDMKAKGATDEQAALEASKWMFDYSLVPQWVRYTRNAPIGSPFLTWLWKSAPRLAEVAMLHPQRLIPWVGLMASLPYLAALAVGGDDDDWRKMKELLPEWARKRSHVAAVPMRDDAGRIQFMDLGPFLPWTMWADFAHNVARGEPLTAAQGLAGSVFSGGPIGSLLIATQTGVDPFTDRPIVPAGEKGVGAAAAWMSYLWTLAMPPVITEQGAFVKGYRAMEGTTNRYGDPRVTGGQAAATLFGLNMYGINPDTTFAMEMSRMSREMQDTRIRMMQQLQDRALSEAQRKAIIDKYTAQLREQADEAREYMQKAGTVSPALKVQTEPAR